MLILTGHAMATDLFWKSGAGAWETSSWGTSSGGPFTSAWGAGNVAVFGGTTGGTVNLGTTESVAGLTFTNNGYNLTGSTITLSANPISIVTGITRISNVIDGTAGLTLTGTGVIGSAGTLILSGANTYSGTTSIGLGATLQAAQGTGLPSASYLTLNGGAYETNGTFTRNNSTTVSGANFSWVAAGGFSAYGGQLKVTIGGSASITQTFGTGAPANNKIVGSLLLGSKDSDSEVLFENNLNLGSAARSVYVPVSANSGAFATLSGVISGASGTLTKGLDGLLVLTGNNTYGNTVINSGTLQIGAGGSTGTLGTGGVTNAATLVFNRSDSYGGSVSNVISGAGAVTLNQGALTLTGANTYGGATTINGGTLKAGVASVVGTSGAFGNNSAVTLANVAGATMDITGYNTQIESLTGGGTSGGNVTLGSATLTVGGNNTSPGAYAGVISGSGGAVTKTGTGVLTLGGSNSYTGATHVDAGTLLVNGNQSAATGAVTVAGYAKLGGTGGTVGGATTIQANGVLAPGGSGSSGNLNFSSTVAFQSGSIFDWDLTSYAGTGATNRGAYDQVNAIGAVTGTGIMNIMLGGGGSFSDSFWTTNKTWNDIFTAGSGSSSMASIFTSFSGSGGISSTGVVSGVGAFSLSGNNLNWSYTAVPETSSAFAGLLLGAGLLRRKRR